MNKTRVIFFVILGIALLIVIAGLVIAGAGLLLTFGEKIPWIGRLPGDIVIRGKNISFYFPVMTCIVVSLLLTLIFSLFRK